MFHPRYTHSTFTKQSVCAMVLTHLALLGSALLNLEVGSLVLRAVSTVPVDLLGRNIAVSVNSEPGPTALSQVTLLVDTEASGVGVVGNSAGVRLGEGDGRNAVLDDVQVLPGSGDSALGEVGQGTVGTTGDWLFHLLVRYEVVKEGGLAYGSAWRCSWRRRCRCRRSLLSC